MQILTFTVFPWGLQIFILFQEQFLAVTSQKGTMISRKLLLSAKPMLSTRGPVPHERRCIQSSTDQKKFKYLRKLLFTHYIKIRYSLRKSYFKSVQGRTVTAIYRCGKIFADCKVKKKNNNTFSMKWKIIKKGWHSHWSLKKIYEKKLYPTTYSSTYKPTSSCLEYPNISR